VRGVEFGMSVKGVISATVATDKWHSGFTPSEQCALHFLKVNYVRFEFTMKRTFPFKYPVDAINCTIFL